jgi:hypothetical protein
VLAWTTTAEAAAKRVGVPAFDGAQEALVRKKVMAVLQAHGFELAKSRQIAATLQSANARLDSNDGFQTLAKELGLQAIVTGEVGKKRAKITVYDGREGSAIGDATFQAANPHKLAAEVGRDFWKKLGSAVSKGRVPSGAKQAKKPVAEAPEDTVDESAAAGAGGEGEEAPAKQAANQAAKKAAPAAAAAEGEAPPKGEAEAEEKAEKKSKKDEEPSGPIPVPPTLDVALGPRLLTRELAYNQPASGSGLRPYKLPGGVALAFDLVFFPITYLTDSFIQNLGVEVHLEQGFAISSQINPPDSVFPQGAKFNTTVHDFAGGLRYRIPYSLGQIYLSATGGEHAFVFKTANTAMPRQNLTIPDTIYQYFRPGLGMRFLLPAELALDVNAGYRMVLNGGAQIKDAYFPNLQVGGVDTTVSLDYRITESLAARASFDWRRYFFAMNSKAGDKYIAGGAVDQYFAGTISIVYLMGGGAPSAAPAAEAAPAKKKRPAPEEGGGEAGGGDGGGGGGDEGGGGDDQ